MECSINEHLYICIHVELGPFDEFKPFEPLYNGPLSINTKFLVLWMFNLERFHYS